MATVDLTRSRTDKDQEHRPAELDKVFVSYDKDGTRQVTCFCQAVVSRSIVPHFKTAHTELWSSWVQTFLQLRAQGLPLKRIMRLFRAKSSHLLFSWTVIERSIRSEVESGRAKYAPPPAPAVTAWKPKEFKLPQTTVWDFPRRGDWAVHSGDYRGNWPPDLVRSLIQTYTRPRQLVVDAFVGGGTTVIEAWLSGRRSVGVDISTMALTTTRTRLGELSRAADGRTRRLSTSCKPIIIEGDSLEIDKLLVGVGIKPGSVKMLCAHPPYLDALTYTSGDPRDLSSLSDAGEFVQKLGDFARKIRPLLRSDGVCAVLIGDTRKRGKLIPLGMRVLAEFLGAGFDLSEIVIKTQHRDRSSEFYIARQNGHLRLAHEYLFILGR